MPGFEPQTDVIVQTVPLAEVAAATERNTLLVSCPDDANFQLELLSVGVTAITAPVSAAGTVLLDIEFTDDSAADAVTNLGTAGFDLETITVRVNNPVFRGSQILDPGDTIYAELVANNADHVVGEGLAAYVEYRILRRS